ncbi:hypothetical protein R3P38DRAFT_3172052 [Favolaschia claudopus]|uniref:Uncharacterized protein n=1 Tax=Favolaschia claudopus TaxID=2862362 RepID=A0AAW0DIL0_9AGAR
MNVSTGHNGQTQFIASSPTRQFTITAYPPSTTRRASYEIEHTMANHSRERMILDFNNPSSLRHVYQNTERSPYPILQPTPANGYEITEWIAAAGRWVTTFDFDPFLPMPEIGSRFHPVQSAGFQMGVPVFMLLQAAMVQGDIPL